MGIKAGARTILMVAVATIMLALPLTAMADDSGQYKPWIGHQIIDGSISGDGSVDEGKVFFASAEDNGNYDGAKVDIALSAENKLVDADANDESDESTNIDFGDTVTQKQDVNSDANLSAMSDDLPRLDISEATIDPIEDQVMARVGHYDTYSFMPSEPTVVVRREGSVLQENVDYQVTYSNNDAPGIAMATIRGIGDYGGSQSVSFVVTGDPDYDISKATISKIDDVSFDPHYDLDDLDGYSPYIDDYSFSVTLDGKTLSHYEDYDYEAVGDLKTGKGTLIITGKGAYFGSATKSFNIVAYFDSFNIRCYNKVTENYDEDDDETSYTYSMKNQTYTGKAIQPDITVEIYGDDESSSYGWYDDYGDYHEEFFEYAIRLKKGTDYKLIYKNNVNLGTATVSVVGIGVYKGTINETFKITYPISKATVSKIAKKTYKGKAIKPQPTVKCLGKTLRLGTDYTLSYKKNKQGGKATVVVNGKGNFTGKLSKTFKIYVPMKKVKVQRIAPQCLYSSASKPNPVVKVGSVKLKLGRDYTLKYKNNRKAGKATVVIKGKGYYKGTKKAGFTIIPKGVGSTISATEYKKIKIGMSYKKVKYLIGGAGKQTSDYSYRNYIDDSYYDEDAEEWIDDSRYETVYCETYEWKGNKSYSGASINFEDGYVVSKNQWGL